MKQTNPKPFVFVLMPFQSDFDDIYQLGIKAACLSAGAYCERVDEQNYDGNILDRVYNQISKADIIISEMTGRNPNVFYETGYSHALNKRVILLTQNADDIPFDLKSYPHIVYSGKITFLKSELEKRIKWSIDNPVKSLSRVDVNFEYLINGMPLYDGIEITKSYDDEYRINVLNISNMYLPTEKFEIAIIYNLDTAINFYTAPADLSRVLPDGRAIVSLPGQKALFPDDMFSSVIYIGPHSVGKVLILRVFSEIGPQDISFKIVDELE